MRLFSGGGRRGLAVTTGLFVGSLFTFIGVTAGPALAATTCSNAAGVTTLAMNADDNVIARINGGNIEMSINGANWVTCFATGSTSDFLVNGSNAGNETFTFFHPADFSGFKNIVDLGNGTDTLNLEYGGLPATASRAAIADPAANDDLNLGSKTDGTLTGDMNFGGASDLRIDNAETLVMNGGDGNDTLDAGNLAGMSSNSGTVAANDIPNANQPFAGNLTLNGGPGDDTLVSGNGDDNFQGGPGTDSVSYVAASGPVTVDLAAATGTGMGNDTLADVQDATGSRFADTITGNNLDNVLNGGPGADTLTGGTGNDTVNGDNGNDWLIAGASGDGKDTYDGGAGLDTVDYSARTADNTLINNGNAVSGEGTENDSIGTDVEHMIGGSGNDTLTVASAGNYNTCSPTLTGGPGDDTLNGGTYCVWADYSGAPGAITVDLVAGTVTGDGNDTISNIARFIGTSGDDTVMVDQTTPLDCFWGGRGIDTIDGSQATSGISIDLNNVTCNAGNAGQDVENAIGGSGDDELNGNYLDNSIWGNDGIDFITGLNGNDNLSGGAGDDSVSGGDGNDKVEGGTGNDSLDGGAGGDTLIYTHSAGKVYVDNQLGYSKSKKGDGSDTLNFFEIVKGSDFNDTIIGGQTYFDANNRLYGRGGNDKLTGTNSSDLLSGGKGKDQIRAGGGDDVAKGGKGNDVLYGSSGDDVLSGSKGRDTGWGGSGNDACRSIERRHSC